MPCLGAIGTHILIGTSLYTPIPVNTLFCEGSMTTRHCHLATDMLPWPLRNGTNHHGKLTAGQLDTSPAAPHPICNAPAGEAFRPGHIRRFLFPHGPSREGGICVSLGVVLSACEKHVLPALVLPVLKKHILPIPFSLRILAGACLHANLSIVDFSFVMLCWTLMAPRWGEGQAGMVTSVWRLSMTPA